MQPALCEERPRLVTIKEETTRYQQKFKKKTVAKSIIWWNPASVLQVRYSVCSSSSCSYQTFRKGTAEVRAVRPERKRQIKLNLLLKYNHWLTVGFPFFDSLNKNVFFCTSGLKPVTSFFFKSSVEQQSLCFGAQMLTWNSSCEMNLMNRRTSESLRTTTATKKKEAEVEKIISIKWQKSYTQIFGF